ncbi:MAG: hypothetical protein GX084_02210 [Acholeplasmataceae bacterium]|nr:hypothetical protein [Acidaminococcaceae bacterium]NLY83414.1 hypothetical protein [Acholeplasmataceae bacterium]
MSIITELESIPRCCLTCENNQCYRESCFGVRIFAHAVEEDEETGKEICPYYIGSDDRHEYD